MRSVTPRWFGVIAAVATIACRTELRAEEAQAPVGLGLVEKTAVRMVVVDVVVLDRSGHAVSGLTADDFEIRADGKEVAVASLESVCPGGAAVDPSQPHGDARDDRAPASFGPRKLVIVLDYQHLAPLERTDVLEKAQAMIRDGLGAGDEVMVAALTGGLRVEQPFSGDRDRTLRTLRRMEYDITLWNGRFVHLSEAGFVQGLSGLFDVLGTVPGPKAVVLYSAMSDAPPLELQFDRVAAMAAGARCSIYPVDVRGLATNAAPIAGSAAKDAARAKASSGPLINLSNDSSNLAATPPGSSLASLARLATESGGRFTERSNALSVGFARAQSDLACTYSIGFYDESPTEDRAKSLVVSVRRPGLRASHPSAYLFRSAAAKRESLLSAAYLSPEMFDTGVLRAHLFPLRPKGSDSWEALLVLSFPVPLADTGGHATGREFGAVLSKGPTLVRRFVRTIRLEPERATTSRPVVTFVERVNLAPGSYTVTAVMDDPKIANPHASKIVVELPEIPRRELFLVEPVLGRPAGANVVVESGGLVGPADASSDRVGDQNSFQPLLVLEVDENTDLLALTAACAVGKRRGAAGSIRRSLRLASGDAIGTFAAVPLSLTGKEKVRCQNLVDVLPARATRRSGAYLFEASLDPPGPDGVEQKDVRFAVSGVENRPKPRVDDAPPPIPGPH